MDGGDEGVVREEERVRGRRRVQKGWAKTKTIPLLTVPAHHQSSIDENKRLVSSGEQREVNRCGRMLNDRYGLDEQLLNSFLIAEASTARTLHRIIRWKSLASPPFRNGFSASVERARVAKGDHGRCCTTVAR